MPGEPKNQLSLTREALSKGVRAKSKFLSVSVIADGSFCACQPGREVYKRTREKVELELSNCGNYEQ